MNAFANNLAVWVGDKLVCVKVAGRANFNGSVDFKSLIVGLWERGYNHFVLDLSDCLLMDSTFLGVLAGLGLRLSGNGRASAAHSNGSHVIELLNPSPRIADLLENLGITHLFDITRGRLTTECLVALDHAPTETDRREVQKTCLEAHQTLMDVNPANVPKFKDVAQFLAEDLKKMDGPDKGT
ncbi:MAG: STAS domain-containing protein [Verrucomicrobia subdivision 3 bacterium]|nr:STAS domain-containing protein [Limisphaerales bacterium]